MREFLTEYWEYEERLHVFSVQPESFMNRFEKVTWDYLRSVNPPAPVEIKCQSGVSVWKLPAGNAQGCLSARMWIDWTQTIASSGTKNLRRRGFLFPQENYVYAMERNRIIQTMLHELDTAAYLPRDEGHSETDVAPFIEDFGKALKLTEDLRNKPTPTVSGKLHIKKVSNGRWVLFHRAWTPLTFESFEEAVAFAKRYIVKRKAA